MKPWKLIVLLSVFAVTFGVGAFVSYRVFRPNVTETRVTSQVILTALRDQGFLVTQTLIFTEPITIEKSSGSVFKDFFFGQTITARGVMEANLGIDLSKITVDDVTVANNTVTVTIPAASVFNVRLVGPLDVQNEQGILKRLLENDNGYNEAHAALASAAEAAANTPDFLSRATARAVDEVTRLLGYVAQGSTIKIVTR